MEKQITILFIGIFLIGIIAGAVGSGIIPPPNTWKDIFLTPTKFMPEPSKETIRYSGHVTFNCGKKHLSIYLDEPNLDIDEDFEKAVKGLCDIEITNIEDWNGRIYQENKFGLKSFDEEKLKEHECKMQNMNYNSSINKCEGFDETKTNL